MKTCLKSMRFKQDRCLQFIQGVNINFVTLWFVELIIWLLLLSNPKRNEVPWLFMLYKENKCKVSSSLLGVVIFWEITSFDLFQISLPDKTRGRASWFRISQGGCWGNLEWCGAPSLLLNGSPSHCFCSL
ncbi:uncharacterized protein LOC124672493 [Lolium rigidum]|uniref:uncharacterized protein LOC124672493 n=1 Tax=Lolium rigidum TaxID=89674 RepID=UPI001F5D0E62|nr:uncharacterized protein LOC124672493 [Lolium rigidum]